MHVKKSFKRVIFLIKIIKKKITKFKGKLQSLSSSRRFRKYKRFDDVKKCSANGK